MYRVVVRGELGDRFAVMFDGMRLSREDGTTVLTGKVADQAQLVGLIQQAQELGLELISVEQMSPTKSRDRRAQRPSPSEIGRPDFQGRPGQRPPPSWRT